MIAPGARLPTLAWHVLPAPRPAWLLHLARPVNKRAGRDPGGRFPCETARAAAPVTFWGRAWWRVHEHGRRAGLRLPCQ
jgi:hypothetical protein